MSDPQRIVNVGLIGVGNFARWQHLPNLARIRECRLRALCDVKPQTLHDAAARYPVDYTTQDARRVFDDPEIDVVVIAVRDDLQPAMSIEALRAGKHVYVEKPLGTCPDDCARVAEAQRQSGRSLAVGFNRRYAPIYRRLKEVVDSSGGCFNVHCRMTDDAWRWASGYPPGYLLHLDACHLLDLLRWQTGAEIESVYCIGSRAEDDCLAVRMSNGCVASIQFSGNGTIDMPKEETNVITQRGGATALDFVELRTFGLPDFPAVQRFAGHAHPRGEYLPVALLARQGFPGFLDVRRTIWELRQQVEQGEHRDRPDAEQIERCLPDALPNFMRDQGWLASLRAFVVGVRDGTATQHAGAIDALQASRATLAAQRSRQSGQVVRLEEID